MQINKPTSENDSAKPARYSGMGKWLTILFILVISVIVVMNLPRGFSDDLSRIGKGAPAIVLIRDKDSVQSFDLMDTLNTVRDEYAGKVDFLLTDFSTPEGEAFMAKNNVSKSTLVLFDAIGKQVNILYPPQTASNLKQEISVSLGVNP